MKKLFKCALCAAVIAPLLMATQCTTYTEPPSVYLIAVENNSDMAIDSLYVGTQHYSYGGDYGKDTIYRNRYGYKIKTAESEKQGYITECYDNSYKNQYGFEIRTADSKVVVDTLITLESLPHDADDIKVTLILEKDGKLRIDKQPVSKK